jgi:hypothetical protein
MNAASVFDPFEWAISGGGLFVFTDSQNWPYTHPCHPLDQRPVSSRASLPLASQPRTRTLRTLLGCQLPPRAVATPRSLSASAMALFFPQLRRRFTSLRLLSFRRHRRMHDSNGTAAHGPVKVSRFLPGVWRLVVPRAFVACFLTICEILFVDSKQRQVAGLFTVSQNTPLSYPAPRIHLGQQANLDASRPNTWLKATRLPRDP